MTTDQDTLSQRKVKPSDIKLLFDWVNDPAVRRASIHSHQIGWNEHQEWFAKKISDPKTLIFIVNQTNIPVGQYRLEINQDNSAVIDISVAKKYRGFGAGRQILNLLEKTAKNIRINKLIAQVKCDNLPSSRLFQSQGFIKDNEYRLRGKCYITYQKELK